MRRSRDIELAVGRALAKSHPWLLKVRQPPDCGLIDFAAVWLYPPAANDPSIEPVQPDTPRR